MPNLRRVLWLAVMLAVPACAKSSSPGADADGGSAASPTAASSAPATASAAAASAPSTAPTGTTLGALTLADRLVLEAQSRPPIHPNADDVLAAFAKTGGTVAAKRQGLGATYKAKFCEGGTTGDGLVTFSICEYPDGDSAKAGLQALQEIYPARGATHVLQKDTVLTTLRLKDGPPAQALEGKLQAAYKRL
jgi:hypothetical protein